MIVWRWVFRGSGPHTGIQDLFAMVVLKINMATAELLLC